MEKSNPEVIEMNTGYSKEEQKVMDKAQVIQEKKQEEIKKQEDVIIAELTEKFGLTREVMNAAGESEKLLSTPETGITTIAEALQFYIDQGLTVTQLTFLAITANSRANQTQVQLQNYAQRLEEVTKQLNAIMEAKVVEEEIKNTVGEIPFAETE
jgi:hypothetical protein